MCERILPETETGRVFRNMMKKERKDATQAYRSVLLLLVPVPAREGKAPVAEGDGA